ncbi:hypothetical protein [uncultured Roseibium sp.]|uniref:hypothetical protein n=1 Tax=uncultured Roseibium sp. TaxID=1936171 RepID=UPI00259334FC|nr:hypothetical protein [uncultured Roseibium sp.]
MSDRQAVFLINLLQDVNILRPLVFMAARDIGLATRILVTPQFHRRDRSGVWGQEIAEMSLATGTEVIFLKDSQQAIDLVQAQSGVLVAASESNLAAHKPIHDVFIQAPSTFLKVTVQHGYESVGLMQSREHDRAHGKKVEFAADVVCVWTAPFRLRSLMMSQHEKLYVTGPSAVLQMDRSNHNELEGLDRGLVCENLHSVRLNVSGDIKEDFLEVFHEFCFHQSLHSLGVTLRPHPGGQYVVKNQISLPENVTLNNNPIYKVDLRRYAYGISAPSSIIIDMILAGIPTAVWSDKGSVMDADNYDGLTRISTVSDWIEFAQEAKENPLSFLELQERFLQKLLMPTDPRHVYERYAKLFDPTIEIEC